MKQVLTRKQRRLVIDQALLLIEHFYVHLPQKEAMYAVDPVQRLKLLRHRLDATPEPRFHAEFIGIFNSLRDLHTIYGLPDPFGNSSYHLPFDLDFYYDEASADATYIVSQVREVTDPTFAPGVQVTHWNGVPIHQAVAANADREAGSNPAARHVRGLDSLTVRSARYSLPPSEDWVVLTYRSGKAAREIRFDWACETFGDADDWTSTDPDHSALHAFRGIDAKAELERRIRKRLFRPKAIAIEKHVALAQLPEKGASAAASASPPDYTKVSKVPDVFSFRTVSSSDKPNSRTTSFGYLRIHTFDVDYYNHFDMFVPEFIRILELLPQNGLILDIRGNPGGYVALGERLLQLLTPQRIEPAHFAFIHTSFTLELCNSKKDLYGPWAESIADAVEVGARFSDALPITSSDSCNNIGQKYQGPVVLITDARSYSTADIFAAGFQDHRIGVILGVDNATGAGGASVLQHADLCDFLGASNSALKKLPKNASLSVAVLRSTRVGDRWGDLLEDLGVKPNETHRITRNDLLEDYCAVDLIARACQILTTKEAQSLAATLITIAGKNPTANITTTNIDRVDVFLDDRPCRTLDVEDGTTSITLDPPGKAQNKAKKLELKGYRNGNLVAAARLSLT